MNRDGDLWRFVLRDDQRCVRMWRAQYRDAKDSVSDVPQTASQMHPLAFAMVAVVVELE